MNADHPLRKVVADPLQACILVVAAMPGLAFIALASVVWTPLGYVMALFCICSYRGVLRATRRMFDRIASTTSRGSIAATCVGIAAAGLILSIPVTQAFLRGDLDAMAAPSIAAQEAGVSNSSTELPLAIYGPSSEVPSYRPCQVVHSMVGSNAAHFCYAQVGYVRLWQMPVALTTLVSITLLYAIFPLAIVWHVSSQGHRTTSRNTRSSKENT